jgi:hypothetical protein
MGNSDSNTLFRDAVKLASEQRRDEALGLIRLLHETAPASRESVTIRVAVLLRGGRFLDALHLLHDASGESYPELQAICLYCLKDPCWEGIAVTLHESSPDESIRKAMGQLLGRVK